MLQWRLSAIYSQLTAESNQKMGKVTIIVGGWNMFMFFLWRSFGIFNVHCVCVCVCARVCVCVCVLRQIFTSHALSVFLFVCLAIYPSVCPSVCLSACLTVAVSVKSVFCVGYEYSVSMCVCVCVCVRVCVCVCIVEGGGGEHACSLYRQGE